MSHHASVVIYPPSGRAPGSRRREAVARDTVRAFEKVGLLPPGAADRAIAEVPTDDVANGELPAGVDGIRLYAAGFLPAIRDLIFAMTFAEFYEGWTPDPAKGETPDMFVVPLLNVYVYSRVVRAMDPYGGPPFESWAAVDFSFEAVRTNLDEIHRIRDEGHPLFGALAEVWGMEPAWTVVMY